MLPLSCAPGAQTVCPRPEQLLPGVEGDLLPTPGCRDPGPQLCGGSKGVGCGGRAEEGWSITSTHSGLDAGMRLPEQEVSREGAGQESRGQRGGCDSSGTRLGLPGFRPVCIQSEAGLVWSPHARRRGPRLASEPGCRLSAGGRWASSAHAPSLGAQSQGPEGQQHLLLGWSSGESLMESVR